MSGFGAFFGGLASGYTSGSKLKMDRERQDKENQKWELEKGDLEDRKDQRERRRRAERSVQEQLSGSGQEQAPQMTPDPGAVPRVPNLTGEAEPQQSAPDGGGIKRAMERPAGKRMSMADTFAARRDAYLKEGLFDDAVAAHEKYSNIRQQTLKDDFMKAVREGGAEGALNFFSDEGVLPNGLRYKGRVDQASGKYIVDAIGSDGRTVRTLPFESEQHAISYGYGLLNGSEFKDYMKSDFERRRAAATERSAAASEKNADTHASELNAKKSAGTFEAQAGRDRAAADASRASAEKSRADGKEPTDVRLAKWYKDASPAEREAFDSVRTGKARNRADAIASLTKDLIAKDEYGTLYGRGADREQRAAAAAARIYDAAQSAGGKAAPSAGGSLSRNPDGSYNYMPGGR